jgi:hypothetical protein
MLDDRRAAAGSTGASAAHRPAVSGSTASGSGASVSASVLVTALCALVPLVAVVSWLVGVPWPIALGLAWAAPALVLAVLLVAGVTSDAVTSSRARPRSRGVVRIPRPRTSAGR